MMRLFRRYAKEDAARVFMTEALLTTLMCTPRSVYAWDMVITRAAGRLFFDKRDGSTLDLLTVRAHAGACNTLHGRHFMHVTPHQPCAQAACAALQSSPAALLVRRVGPA